VEIAAALGDNLFQRQKRKTRGEGSVKIADIKCAIIADWSQIETPKPYL